MENNNKKIDLKQFASDFKKGFLVGVKDKKRWLVCSIEILIAVALVAIDLITKEFIYGHCKENGRINIIEGVICFTSVENTGGGFGIFSDSTLALTIVSILCSVFLSIFIFYSYQRRNLWLRSALIMILGGAGMKPIMVPDLVEPTMEIEEMLYAKFDSLLQLRDYLIEQETEE